MATKLTTRAMKFAKINGQWINTNLITSIDDNGNSTIIYFGDRNMENQGYIELFNVTPDQVMNEILADLNGETKPTTASASAPKAKKADLEKFIREQI